MKKIVFTACLASISVFSSAQFVNFESLTLPQAESYYNGSDGAGGFNAMGIYFSNDYTQAGDYWNGFVYSNMTDVTTPGYANQYSAFAGSGADASEKYAICYPTGKITFPQLGMPQTAKITNTTFAGISMRDGDAYAKKFGSLNNAQGIADSTNGEDFFKLTINGLNSVDEITGSVDVYLADFRFADNAQDFILNTWKSVDLTSLGNVYGLSFDLQSSDVGDFGMNTPGYFALDDLVFISSESNVAEQAKQDFKIYPNPINDWLSLKGGNGIVQIVDLTGKVVQSFEHQEFSKINVSNLESGTYFVQMMKDGIISSQKLVK
jgi:hypothetical protein